MRTLVAGGAGFIGSHLIDALLENNHQVICIDNLSLGTKENIIHLETNPNFIFYEVDICDYETLKRIFENEEIDYVFHLAANSDIQSSASNPEIEFRNTYTTTYNLLECMRIYKVKKLFFSSTSAVYGEKIGIELDENTPNLQPVSYYGAAKLGSEALISAYSYMNDFEALIFRFPNVIGPRLTHGVIYDFMKKLEKDQKKLQILGDGNQTKPYMHINDLIRGIIMFMNTNTTGVSLYNIGVDSETSVKKIADILCEEANLKNVVYEFTGGSGGWKGDVPRFRYNLDKIHSNGWKAFYTSDEAVRMTINHILSVARKY